MKTIWLNRHGRVRAGWKIALVIIISMLLDTVVNGVASLNINSRRLFDPDGLIRLLQVPNLYFILVVWFAVRRLEKRSLASVGLTNPLRSGRGLAAGMVVGAAGITVTVMVLVLLGRMTVGWGEPGGLMTFSNLILLYSSCLLPGLGEELLFRGYINWLLTDSFGRWAGVLAGSGLFALLHLGNEGIGVIGLINLFGFAIVASLMTEYTGSLWMAVSFHFFWNLTQGFLFTGAISGTEANGIFKIVPDGESWLTGGDFGVEGSVVASVAIGVLTLLLYRKTVARRKVSICHKTMHIV